MKVFPCVRALVLISTLLEASTSLKPLELMSENGS